MSSNVPSCAEVNMKRVFYVVLFMLQFFCVCGRGNTQFLNNFLNKTRNNIICENFDKNKDACLAKIRHQNFSKHESNIRAELLCVQIHSAAIIWTTSDAIEKNYAFAIQIFSSANQSTVVRYPVNDTQYKHVFSNLQANTEYNVSISRIDSSGLVFFDDVTTLKFVTKPENFKPLPPSWFNVTDLNPINQNSTSITVKWNFTNEGKPCYYEIHWRQNSPQDYGKFEPFPREHPQANEYEIKNLKYYETYTISMITYLIEANQTNGKIENKTSIYYNVPSCLKIFNNLSICPIPPVEDIQNEINCDYTVNCSVGISWSVKDFQPDYYFVTIEKVNASGDYLHIQNLSTTDRNLSIFLPDDTVYAIRIRTVFNETASEPTATWFRLEEAIRKTKSGASEYYIHFTIILIVLLLLLVTSTIIHLRKQKNTNKFFQPLKKFYNQLRITNMEPIISNFGYKKNNEGHKYQLVLGKIRGKGNFGVVYEGMLMIDKKKVMDVAVKTLQDNATMKEIQQFEKEISLMEDVGVHNNIVCMIGSCYHAKRPLLIVEYCSLGDLRTYLCNIKKTLVHFSDFNSSMENQYQNLVTIQSGQQNSKYLVHNKIYGVAAKDSDVIVPELSICDLLSFGRQVAIGMEYLASNYVVHRDLAARNVLLCSDKTVKISDFGLSRDIYAENIYRKLESNEPLPIKWMAPESIGNQEYSTWSDVWSYGIFLWELFTMGDEPYSNIFCPQVLYSRLKEGYRMQNPCTSYPELYEIMLNCWQETPELRPQFSELRELLERILLKCSPHQYITITGND